jgi:hypothetical protein
MCLVWQKRALRLLLLQLQQAHQVHLQLEEEAAGCAAAAA